VNRAAGVSLDGGGSSDLAAAVLDTHPVSGCEGRHLSIQTHRHLGEKRGQRFAIRLVAPELLGFVGQADQNVLDPLPDVVAELLVLGVELLPQIALPACDQVVELRESLVELLGRVAQVAPEILVRPGASILFLAEALAERLDLGLHVNLEGGKALSDLVAEVRGLLDQAILEPCELAVVIAHLPAKQQVADFVEIARCGSTVRIGRLRLEGFRFAASRHGSLPWLWWEGRGYHRNSQLPISNSQRREGRTRLALPVDDCFFIMCDEMSERFLTDFELMVMLAVLRVRDEAYGVPIAREIEETAGRSVTHAAVYLALDRLCQHGLATSRLGNPTPERGGRAKKLFSITPTGVRAIRRTQSAFIALWKGIPELKGTPV
jgi:PadR family transcriptional regulator, regulatory protein PadR